MHRIKLFKQNQNLVINRVFELVILKGVRSEKIKFKLQSKMIGGLQLKLQNLSLKSTASPFHDIRLRRIKAFSLILLTLALVVDQTQQISQCSNANATLYDGYLEPFIYFANFNRSANPYLKFKNPFDGKQNFINGSVTFWAKFPLSNNEAQNLRGRILECNNQLKLHLDLYTLVYNATTFMTNAKGVTVQPTTPFDNSLNVTLFNKNSYALSMWNNYAFSVVGKKMRVHINGLFTQETTMNAPNLTSSSDFCVVGNSLDFTQPLGLLMRHLVFGSLGYDSNNIVKRVRSNLLPTDSSVLAYFKFHKDYNQQETYYYNSSLGLSQQGVTIQMSSEPEQVCYCTKPSPSFLKLSNNFKLKQLDFTPYSTFVDSNGVTITFQIFAQQLSTTNDQVIMGIDKYADIVLANQGQYLRVDLYSAAGTVQQSVVLSDSLFRFNFWTTYSIQILSGSIILSVDDVVVTQTTHQVSLPKKALAKLNIALSPTAYGLTFLLNKVQVIQETQTRPTIFDRQFTQDVLLPSFQNTNVTSGRLVFEPNSQLCSSAEGLYSPATFIPSSGLGPCISNRLAVSFTNSSSSYSTSGSTLVYNTALSMKMKSASPSMTIEMWIRDLSQIKAANQSKVQVLLENSIDSKTVQTQIQILPSQTLDSQRRFVVYPQASAASSRNVVLTSANTYNIWVHLSLVSSPSGILMALYNTFDSSQISSSTPGIAFTQVTTNGGYLNTSVGSSLNGANKFQGLMREFRIFSVQRTDLEIKAMRYSTSYNNIGYAQDGTQILLHAFKLNEGFDYQNLYDSMISPSTSLVAGVLDEKAVALSSFTWLKDEDLVLCTDNYYYDGQCCRQFDFSMLNSSVVDINFAYSSSKSYIRATLVPGSLTNASMLLQLGYKADFKFVSVGNDFDSTKTNSVIQGLFTQSNSQGFSVYTYLVDPMYFSISIQATIYTPYQIRNALVVTKTLQLLCPRFQLNLNNLTQSVDDSYMLSNSTNHLVRIIAKQNTSTCFNNFTKSIQQISINKVAWTHNLTSKYTFAQLFNTSSDSFTVDQRFEVSGLTRTLLTATITYNTTMTATYSMILDYQSIAIDNGYSSPLAVLNQRMDIPTSFSFTNAFLNPNPSQVYSLAFKVNCPPEIFKTQQQMSTLCVFTGSQFYLDTSSTSDFNIRQSKSYLFEFIVYVPTSTSDLTSSSFSSFNSGGLPSQLYVMKSVQVSVTYYVDGSSQASCPSVAYRNDYVFDKVNNVNFEMNPVAYLYCSELFYQFKSVSWVVTDYVSKKTLSNVLSFTAENPLSVYLRSDNKNVQAIASGSVLQLNGTFTTLVANSTSLTGATKIIYNQIALVTFKVVQFVPQIIATTFAKSPVSNGQIEFLQPNITLNASTSYDPDNTAAVLWYQWTCPPEISNCTSNVFGQRSNSFIIDFWFRFRNGLNYGQNYTFSVMTWSKDNTFKAPQSLSYNVSFLPPQNTDINYGMPNTSCESLDVDNSVYILKDATSNLRTIWLSRSNYTSVFFNLISKLDNGALAQKSPCGFGNATNILLLAYFTPGILADNASPFVLYNNTNVSSIQNRTQQFQFSLATYSVLQSILSTQVYNLTFYQLVQRAGSNRTFVNTLSLQIQKSKSPLEIIVSSVVIVDAYQDLVINPSRVIDSSTQANVNNLIYTWTCPNSTLACGKVAGSKLVLTYTDRANAQVNSALNTAGYLYSVLATDSQGRQSDIYFIHVYITKLADYSGCLSLSLNGTIDLSKFSSNNNTFYVEQNQYSNTTFTVVPSTSCTNANLVATQWTSLQTLTSSQIYFAVSSVNTSIVTYIAGAMKYLKTWQNYTLKYEQSISMGQDAALYTKSTFINLVVNPQDLQAKISGQSLVVDGLDTAITLSGSNSIDPLNIPYDCFWTCPDTLGLTQSVCNQAQSGSNNCQISFTILSIKTIQGDITKFGALTDWVHNFQLTVISRDYVRVAKTILPVYLSAGLDTKLQGKTNFSSCDIQIVSNQGLFVLDRVNQFKIGCVNSTDESLLLNQGFNWQVQGLTSATDYYQLNNMLYINSYVASKLITSYLNVTVFTSRTQATTNSNTNINTRLLEAADGPADSSADSASGGSTSSQQDPVDVSTLMNITLNLGYSKVFPFARSSILQMGSISIGTFDGTSTSQIYLTNYTFTFSGFSYAQNFTLYLQLRAYSTVHSDQDILTPLKAFSQQNLNAYFTQVFLSQFSYLAIDFYDSALNYVDTYDLTSQAIFSSTTVGSQQYTDFDKRLFPIVQKSYSDYPQTIEGRIQVEKDFYQVAMLVEMLRAGKVTGVSSSIKNAYALKILAYLKFSLSTLLGYYDASVSIEYADARYNLEKTVLVIIYDLVLSNSNIQQSFQSVLSVLVVALQDYDELIDYSEDPELIRSIVLYLQVQLNIQLLQSTLSSKQTYFNQISNIKTIVAQNDIVQASQSTSQMVSITTSDSSRTIYKILPNDTQPIKIMSSLNSKEYVALSDPTLLANLSISTLLVQFGKDSNSTSAVSSTLDIQAFAADQSIVPINFDKGNNTIPPYFEYGMQLNSTQRQMVVNATADTTTKDTFNFTCVYLNTTQSSAISASSYSTMAAGITTVYNSSSSLITCRTTHLTPFSVIFSKAVKQQTDNGGGGGVIIDPNNTNNQSNPNNVSQDSNQTSSAGPYYAQNSIAYIVSIVVTAGVAFATIFIAMCHRYQLSTERHVMEQRAKYPFSKILFTVLRTHHPLWNCFATMKYPNLAIPKYINILIFWTYMFGISFWSVVIFESQQHSDIPKGYTMLAFAAVFWAVVLILRPVHNYVVYTLYHSRQADPLKYIDEDTANNAGQRVQSATMQNLRASQSYNQNLAANASYLNSNNPNSFTKSGSQSRTNLRSSNLNRNNLKLSGGKPKSTEARTYQHQALDLNRGQDLNRNSMGPTSTSRLQQQRQARNQNQHIAYKDENYIHDFDQFEGGSREEDDKSAIYEEDDIDLTSSEDEEAKNHNGSSLQNPQNEQQPIQLDQTVTTNNLSLYVGEIQEEEMKDEGVDSQVKKPKGGVGTNQLLLTDREKLEKAAAKQASSNFKGPSTIGKQHQDALNIQIEEEESESYLSSPNLTEGNHDSPDRGGVLSNTHEESKVTQINLQGVRKQLQMAGSSSPLNTHSQSQRSFEQINFQNSQGQKLFDEEGVVVERLESTKKVNIPKTKSNNNSSLADEYGPPSASKVFRKQPERQFQSFMSKDEMDHKREISEVYADEMDRLPAEPEPEFIPNESNSGRRPIQRALDVRDVEIEVEDDVEPASSCSRSLLIVLLFLQLLGEMAITYALSRQIDSLEFLINWIVSISIIALALVFVVDSLRLLIFAFVYAGKQPHFREVRCAAFFLLGNFNLLALQQLQLEIQI